MKTSKYIIKVKISNDKYLLVHGYSGAVDIVNTNIIRILEDGNFELMNKNDFSALQRRGYIVSENVEEKQVVRKIAKILQTKSRNDSTFTIIVTYDCNFRCSYCIEGKISDYGKKWTRESLTKNKINAIYEVIDKTDHRIDKKRIIALYGGEPLLKENFQILEYLIKKGEDRDISFVIVTNGYDIRFFEKIIKRSSVLSFQITLDGSEKTHNTRRPHYENDDSFSTLISNISWLLNNDKKVNIRINIDKNNTSNLTDLVYLFDEKGWTSNCNFSTYISPIHIGALEASGFKLGQTVEYNYASFSLFLKNDIISFIKNNIKQDDRFSIFGLPSSNIQKNIKNTLESKKNLTYKGSYCSATMNGFIFDPQGNIYTCWEIIGDPSLKVGEYYPEFFINKKKLKQWRNRDISNIYSCSSCKYALFCGGGCAAQSLKDTKNIYDSYCDNFKSLFNIGVKDAYSDFQS